MTAEMVTYGRFCAATGIIKTVERHPAGEGPRSTPDTLCVGLPDGMDPRTIRLDVTNPLGPFLPYEPPVNIEKLRRRAIARVNAKANRLSSSLRTDGERKARMYAEKRRQAEDWLASSGQDPSDYDLVYADHIATGKSMDAVAETILAKAKATDAIDRAIEATLRVTVEALRTATIETIETIENVAEWPDIQT